MALAPDLQPGFHRIPQAEAGITLDLLAAPLESALAELNAHLDCIRLHDPVGSVFARPLARLTTLGAHLVASGLEDARRQALAAQGFVFGTDDNAVFASRKPRLPVTPQPVRHALVLGAGLAGCALAARLCARGWKSH